MELNKDIADISAAEAESNKGKRFILCYHDYNIKNFESALVQIEKITKVVGSPISIAVVPSIGAVPEEERERFCESIEKLKASGLDFDFAVASPLPRNLDATMGKVDAAACVPSPLWDVQKSQTCQCRASGLFASLSQVRKSSSAVQGCAAQGSGEGSR